MTIRTWAVVLLMSFAARAKAQGIIHVDAGATGANNGSSWFDAYTSLQVALSAAKNGDQVWVAEGVYKPTTYINLDSRKVSFRLDKPLLSIYGGFKGYVSPSEPGETSLEARPGLFLTTVLSGDLLGDDPAYDPNVFVKHTDATRDDNSYSVISALAPAGPGTVIDGFLVIDGNADLTTVQDVRERGAGLLVTSVEIQARNLIFRRNSAKDAGGAVSIGQGASPTLEGCVFERNVANNAGGAMVINGAQSNPVIRDSTFLKNAAQAANGSTVGTGGAVALEADPDPTFERCVFDRNSCRGFKNGNPGAPEGGAAVNVGNGDPRFGNCLFSGNLVTTQTGSDGGALYCANGSNPVLENCTFAANACTDLGGAVFLEASNVVLTATNCIFWGNRGGVSGYGDNRDEIHDESPVPQTNQVSYSCVRHGFPGFNNILFHPAFVNELGPDALPGTGDEDLRLAKFSPCVDTGTETTALVDVEGVLRRLDGNADFARVEDMGAYEFADPTGFRFWLNPGGGAFTDAFSWDVGVPTEANGAYFAEVDNVPYTVGISTGVTSDRLLVRAGDLKFQFSGGSTYALDSTSASGTFLLGGVSDAAPTLTMLGSGSLATPTGSIACVGDSPTDVGTLVLNGPGVSMSIGDDLCVGNQGEGTMLVLGGALAASMTASIGDKPGSLGQARISDPGSMWHVGFFLQINNGSVRVVNGGELDVGLAGALILPKGLLAGDSGVTGNVLSIGEVAPGDFLPTPTIPAVLTIDGSYSQFGTIGGGSNDSGVLRVRVGSSAGVPVADRLEVTGTAKLAGGLIVERDASYAEPKVGDVVEVVQAGTLEGTFDVAFLPGFGEGQFARVNYPENGSVTLSIESLGEILSFLSPVGSPLPGSPSAAALGDVNPQASAKGPDLVVAVPDTTQGQPGDVLVLLNNGTGPQGWLNFGGAAQVSVGIDPAGLAVADFDQDGDDDIAVTQRGEDTVLVLLSDGAGGFTPRGPFATGNEPTGIVAADFDGVDGPDLAIGCQGSSEVSVLLNTGAAIFENGLSKPLIVGEDPVAITAGDFDGDGDLDLATASAGSDECGLAFNDGPEAGKIIFEPCPVPVGPRPTSISIGKVGGEAPGSVFLVVSNSDSTTVSVIVIEPDPGATPRPIDIRPHVELEVGSLPRSLALADADSDGDADVFVIANGIQQIPFVNVLRLDAGPEGQVAFAPAQALSLGDSPVALLSGDVDLDGLPDLVAVSNSGGDALPEWKGRINDTKPACYADCEGDGDLDLFDFLCFQGKFATQQPYADCEEDGDFDLFDFLCFQGKFAQGCP